jgi:hypothetical protein
MRVYFWAILSIFAVSEASASAPVVTVSSVYRDGQSTSANSNPSGSFKNIQGTLQGKSFTNGLTRNSLMNRGGSTKSSSIWTPQSKREISGALIFIILDKAFRSFFTANKIAFPSQLGGCIVLFIALTLSELVKTGTGEATLQALAPGAALLAKWLPVFFVPGLAMLPLAPSMGGPIEVCNTLHCAYLFPGCITISFYRQSTFSADAQGTGSSGYRLLLHVVDVGLFCLGSSKTTRSRNICFFKPEFYCSFLWCQATSECIPAVFTSIGSFPLHCGSCSSSFKYWRNEGEPPLGPATSFFVYDLNNCDRLRLGCSSTGRSHGIFPKMILPYVIKENSLMN